MIKYDCRHLCIMWWHSFIALALVSLIFCTWLWIIQLPHITNTQDVITSVEVSLIGEVVASTETTKNPKKNICKITNKSYEIPEFNKNRQRHSVPRFMLDLYEKATAAKQNDHDGSGRHMPDVIKGLIPRTTASMLGSNGNLLEAGGDRRHLLVFEVPSSNSGETLQSAELRVLFTTAQHITQPVGKGIEMEVQQLVHVYLLEEQSRMVELDVKHVLQQQGDTWLSFNVTAAILQHKPHDLLRLLVHIRATSPHSQVDLMLATHPHEGHQFQDVQPLLLLSYSTPMMTSSNNRDKRDAEDYEEESNNIWDDDRVPAGSQVRRTRKQRNTCRRRPLYVDFSEIHYDTWIVAPSGYEAFQCSGKCFYPVSDHLSPTKHAIVQTLLHSVAPSKVPRACCVPTRLESISVLYVDQKGVLTYRFSYQDMVVAECGCR